MAISPKKLGFGKKKRTVTFRIGNGPGKQL